MRIPSVHSYRNRLEERSRRAASPNANPKVQQSRQSTASEKSKAECPDAKTWRFLDKRPMVARWTGRSAAGVPSTLAREEALLNTEE